jgi:hypothetical protein
MLQALAEGETDPAALAAVADQRLRATSTEGLFQQTRLFSTVDTVQIYSRIFRTSLGEASSSETLELEIYASGTIQSRSPGRRQRPRVELGWPIDSYAHNWLETL